MAAAVFALGFLIFTLMLKVAVPISLGEFTRQPEPDRHMDAAALAAAAPGVFRV